MESQDKISESYKTREKSELLKSELISLTSDLIRFRSDANHPSERVAILKYVKNFLSSNSTNESFDQKYYCSISPNSGQNIESYHFFNPDPKIARMPSLLLLLHADVVPGSSSQFEPYVKNNFLHGRGAGDMKAGLAIALKLFLKYHETTNIQILVTTDEEIGGFGGAGYVAPHINPDFVIAIEPSNLKIINGEKGAMWVVIDAEGPGGHAARPWKAKSAVDLLFAVYSKLREKFPAPATESWIESVNLGGIYGGDVKVSEDKIVLNSANSIPKYATAKLDLRLSSDWSHNAVFEIILSCAAEVQEGVRNCFDGCKDYKITVHKPNPLVSILHTPKDNIHVANFANHISKVLGCPPIFKKGHGASDARFFSERKIPSIIFGGLSIGHHGDQERVCIDSLLSVYESLDLFLANWVL
ncbi:M20/M25/M40 family metallo-hydrolase [Candidatus Woesearchaeota archaeon]|nr:M20/M25/M40 family metallo-hydrolase [Candidatus Woesearchaeota archaeon]